MKMVTIVAISAWLGVLVFLAFVVAPAAFGSLERGAAARLISVVMPRYHWIGLGLGITLVASLIYVFVWELYLAYTDYSFMDTYTETVLEDKRAGGASAEELAQLAGEMESMKELYANPLFRLPMTFVEIFPVGVLVSLVSAALLRNSRFLPARGAPPAPIT